MFKNLFNKKKLDAKTTQNEELIYVATAQSFVEMETIEIKDPLFDQVDQYMVNLIHDSYKNLFIDLSVVQEFRQKHLQPMIELKDSIIQELKTLEIEPVFVSARLKMIATISDKLKTGRHKKLSTMQDLGGVRVVVKNYSDLDKLHAVLLESKSFEIVRTKDYIKEPKETGYHGIHIIYKIDGYNIELQLRTEGQHIWASTVETVGWHLKQDLKSGKGDKQVLRFFQESANLLNEDICYNNISWVRECKIDNVSGIEFLQSIHQDYSMSDCEKMDAICLVITQFDHQRFPSISSFQDRELAFAFYSERERVTNVKFCCLVSLDKYNHLLNAYPCFFSQTKQFVDYMAGVKDYNQLNNMV